jgi:hypothetical protein
MLDVMKEIRKIKPAALLYDIRKQVSELLNRPFSERIDHQIFKPDQRLLMLWAVDCAEHVLPFFEEKYPLDNRPSRAIEEGRRWVSTGVFSMKVIRGVSLGAHNAAKVAAEDDARFAAHAAGQAVGTAHVVTHSFGSSMYGVRAAAAHSGNVDDGLVVERKWQIQQLLKYIKMRNSGLSY